MGLFDTFIPDEPLTCPACDKPHIKDLQTKQLDNSLTRFKIGDSIESVYEPLIIIANGKIDCYEWCNETASMVYYWALIENNIFTGLEYRHIWKRDEEPNADVHDKDSRQ